MRPHKIMLLSLLERGGTLSANMSAREISSDIGQTQFQLLYFLKGCALPASFILQQPMKHFKTITKMYPFHKI